MGKKKTLFKVEGTPFAFPKKKDAKTIEQKLNRIGGKRTKITKIPSVK